MSQKTNYFLIKSASYFSIIIALIITLLKFYAYINTDSQSILASLVDSMLDISSSIMNFFAIRIALMPPDDKHRFGHEKFEDLAVFSQSIFFFTSCLFMFVSAGKALFLGQEVENNKLGTDVMYICIFLNLALVVYQSYVVKKTGSKIIAADKLHYFTDFLTSAAVIASLYLSSKISYIDPIFAAAIAIYIFYASYKLFKQAISCLSDEEFTAEEKEKILKIVANYKEITGIHELKTRHAGNKAFIQFHIEMDGKMSLYEAHNIADKLMEDLYRVFPVSEIIIHQDPSGEEIHVNYREKLRV